MSFPRYQKYKPSGVEWLGEVPEHWSAGRFSRVISRIKDGTHGSFERVSDGKPLLSAKNVQDGYLILSENESLVSEEDHLSIVANGFPKKSDLLLTIVGTIGRSCVYNFEYSLAFQRSVCFIRLSPGNESKFFYYFTQSKFFQEQLISRSKSAAQGGIYMGDVVATHLAYPPLAEQVAIAEFLDRETGKIDELVAEQRRLIELLKEKRQAVISHAVTKGLNPHAPMKPSGIDWLGDVPEHWEVKPLRSVFKFSKGLTITKENLQDEGVYCVNYGEIHSKYGFRLNPLVHPLRCVSHDYLFSHPDALIHDGDFVFADTSEDLEGSGNFTHLKSNNPIFAGYHTIIARPCKCSIALFLAYQIHSSAFRSQIQKQVKGVKVFSISQGILKATKCLLPPLSEQTAIVAFLETELSKFDALTAEAQRTITLLQERRTALISAAVTGQIDVRGDQI